MAEAPRSLDQHLQTLAQNLRHLRAERSWSQDDLASASGISRRMIAALEAAQNNVSLSTLDHIAAAFGLTFTELVSPRLLTSPGVPQSGEVLWQQVASGSSAILLGSVPARRNTELWRWRLGPGETYAAQPDPQGMAELLYVLQGELTLDLEDRSLCLQAGQSVSYPSDRPYTYRNAGDVPTEFIRNVTL